MNAHDRSDAAPPEQQQEAGGAMSYVVVLELLPDSLRAGSKSIVAAVFIAGIAMVFGLSMIVGR